MTINELIYFSCIKVFNFFFFNVSQHASVTGVSMQIVRKKWVFLGNYTVVAWIHFLRCMTVPQLV